MIDFQDKNLLSALKIQPDFSRKGLNIAIFYVFKN